MHYAQRRWRWTAWRRWSWDGQRSRWRWPRSYGRLRHGTGRRLCLPKLWTQGGPHPGISVQPSEVPEVWRDDDQSTVKEIRWLGQLPPVSKLKTR